MDQSEEDHHLPSSVHVALEMLFRSVLYAADADRDRWDFAVEIDRLLGLGLSQCELRWLLARDYVECAMETTADPDGNRRYTNVGGLRFGDETCFVLSESGEQRIRDLLASGRNLSLVTVPTTTLSQPESAAVPSWNEQRRTLTVGQEVVKCYRVPAENQELILRAFQEEEWPERIFDPLSPVAQQDPKRRLQSAIMCLNRNQLRPLIRFRGDGSGTGILWELSECGA